MVTCIQCGNALPEGETACDRCGASAATGDDAVERHVPAGTWSEHGTGEVAKVPDKVEGRDSSPSVITFRETAQRAEERPEDAPVIRPEPIVRDPDLTPVPGLALAFATQPKPRDEESTGTRPTVASQERQDRTERGGLGQVVPLRREQTPVPVGAALGNGAGSAPVEGAGGRAAPAAPKAEPNGVAQAETAPSDPTPTAGEPAEPRPEQQAGGEGAAEERARTQAEETPEQRPPVLASECLREDMAPTEPGRTTLRWISGGLGAVSAALVLVIGLSSPFAWLLAALLAAMAGLGAAPMRYEARSAGVAVLGVAGLVVAIVATGVAAVPPILAVTVVILGAGLLFRGVYRASGVARVLTGIGIALGLIWFIGSGTITGLSVADTSWQSVAGAIVRLAFLLLLLLSLLAFMDSSTTAGCRVWGAAILGWYGIYVLLELAVRMWPAPGQLAGGPDGLVARVLPGDFMGPPSAEVTAVTIAAAALVILTGLAASHVLVSASGGTVTKRQADAEASRA